MTQMHLADTDFHLDLIDFVWIHFPASGEKQVTPFQPDPFYILIIN